MSPERFQREFPPLALPAQPLRVDMAGGRIYDPLRHKWVALTPEEWVRQNVTAHMVNSLGYPPQLMANEVGLRLNSRLRRCDTIVWRAGTALPLLIVEYKAPHIALTQRVVEQVMRYNMVFQAPWLMVSNGLSHVWAGVGSAPREGLPAYGELVQKR